MHRRLAALSLVLGLAGCRHSGPFTPPQNGSDQPRIPGSPRRLTYNLGDDRTPAWLPDESLLIYSFQRLDRPDLERCLATLPPDGGRQVLAICDPVPTSDDSTDAFEDPAVDASGRLAYVAASSPSGALAPHSSALVLGTLAAPLAVRVLQPLPYIAADGTSREGISHVRWLGPDTLVYVVEHVGYERPCLGCPPDTLRTGLELVRLDAGAPAPVGVVLPGTASASSVAAGARPGVIYYTLNGDSRVFRRDLAAGTDSVVHDFGAAGIARDVQVAGTRLAAVVGGNVSFAYDSLFGYPVQRDRGGSLHVVDLSSGADTVLAVDTLLFRRPALSPSGHRLVVEAANGGSADLWEFDLP